MSAARKTVTIAMLTASAIILGYLESLIPAFIPIPGAKIGLSNIVTLLSLNILSAPITLFIVAARILLSGFMFSNLSAVIYSLSGGVLSWAVMSLMVIHNRKHSGAPFSILFISVIGAIFHNIGQLIAAVMIIQNKTLFFYYLPFLILIAIPTGLLIGFIVKQCIKYLPDTYKKNLP